MNVLHLIPSLSSGGVEQVVLELCEGLEGKDVHNCVISSGGAMVEAILATGASHIQRPIGGKNLRSLYEVLYLRKLLKKLKPDIVHLHSRVPAWICYLALKGIAKDERPKMVTSFHGFHSVNAYSAIMAKGEAVVAVSHCMKQHILDNYPACPEENITVIPNSVDEHLFYPAYTPSKEWTEKWNSDYPELKGRLTLCLPGRITKLKGAQDIPALLKALHKRDIAAHAVIVGETKKKKKAYKEKLLQLFETEGVTPYTTWTGHRKDLREILASCDITLSLTLQPESFGKTTLEALALGRPVAGYEHGGVGEQLDLFLPEGRCPLGDIEFMANRIAQWHQNPPSPAQALPTPYKRESMIRAHLELYQDLLSRA